MFKRIISLMVSAALIICLSPAIVFADSGASERDGLIHSVHLSNFCVPPIAGTETGLTSNIMVETADHCTFADGYFGLWWDHSSGQPVLFSGEFVAGNSYSQGAVLDPVDGYAFAEDLVIYVNGNTEYVDMENTLVENGRLFVRTIPFECIAEPFEINEIRIEGFEYPPVAGENADASLSGVRLVGDVPYFFSEDDLCWFDNEADDFFHGEFELGKTYSVFFPVMAPYGYRFADNVSIYINGRTDLVSEEYVYNFEEFFNFYSIDFVAVEAPVEPDFIYGDADLNGEITVADAILTLRHAIGISVLTGTQLLAADVDGVPGITLADSILIAQRVLGLIDAFPVEAQ